MFFTIIEKHLAGQLMISCEKKTQQKEPWKEVKSIKPEWNIVRNDNIVYQTHATDSKRLPTVVFGVKVPPFQSMSKCKLGNTRKLHMNSIELKIDRMVIQNSHKRRSEGKPCLAWKFTGTRKNCAEVQPGSVFCVKKRAPEGHKQANLKGKKKEKRTS